jgi:protein farnesyltransferase/geranylgeranyltransferase type-1 subunit alpha
VYVYQIAALIICHFSFLVAQEPTAKVPQTDPTIAAKLEAEYQASRPYQVLKDTKGLSNLTPNEKAAYVNYRFLETSAWKTWPAPQQKEFWKSVEQQKIPIPLPKPKDLGKDSKGGDIRNYTPEEYRLYQKKEGDLQTLREKSTQFKQKGRKLGKQRDIGDIEDERNLRKLVGVLQRKKMGKYEGDPEWDDVVPIPQDDGERALAQIAYTDEYAEGELLTIFIKIFLIVLLAMGYLRAVMAAKEYSQRVLDLTEHIISMNAAHYTVWLYRASTIFALNADISQELNWINEVALDNQKNYQIWHHRQLLLDHLYPGISSDSAALQDLAESEIEFMTQMFDEDAKNYHVWSYRQYFVRKLNLFNDAELKSIETLLRTDIRNNSAWSHRFYVVFSDPKHSTSGSRATEHDPRIPDEIIDREIEFSKSATFEAPQNQSPWNYLRGVLRKGGRKLSSQECFANEFVKIPEDGEEDIRSSHALDFLADVWAEEGKTEKADEALRLLGDKYDRIRKNYWDWRRVMLKEDAITKAVEKVELGQ